MFTFLEEASQMLASTILPIYEEARRQKLEVSWKTRKTWDEQGFCIHAVNDVGPKGIYHPHSLALEEGFPFGDTDCGILVSGPIHLEGYLNTYPDVDPNKFKLVGFPKSDLLVSYSDAILRAVENRLNLPYDQTILWADDCVSFHEEFVWIREYPYILEILDKLCKLSREHEINLIIRPHWTQINPDYRLGEYIPPEKFKGKGIRWIDPTCGDITEFFLVSDMLFWLGKTSVSIEYLATGMPVMSYHEFPWIRDPCRVGKFLDLLSIGFEDLKIAGLTPDLDGLEKSVLHTLANPSEFAKERKKLSDFFIYKPDGGASKRAVQAIKELTEIDNE